MNVAMKDGLSGAETAIHPYIEPIDRGVFEKKLVSKVMNEAVGVCGFVAREFEKIDAMLFGDDERVP